MRFHLYDIRSELQPFIKSICSLEYDSKEEISSFQVLPDTCAELCINYSSNCLAEITDRQSSTRKNSFFTFRMTKYMDVKMQAGTGCIAICFYPGTVYKFLSVSMDNVADSIIDMHDLWGNGAEEIENKIVNAGPNNERVDLIQEFLFSEFIKTIKHDKLFENCLWQINYLKGQLSIKDLAQNANISQRQLSRRFNNCIGLAPKEYARINRFLHSINYLKKNPSLHLTDVTYESGYFDQAHFIHDCKEYSGLTPGELLSSSRRILF